MITNRPRSYSVISVILVVVMLLNSGCTVMGFALGESVDRAAGAEQTVRFDSLSSDCQKGDQIIIVLVAGGSLKGKILSITQGISITLSVLDARTSPYRNKDEIRLRWSEILQLGRIEKASWGRVGLTTVGLGIDLLIVYLIARNVKSVGN